MGKWYRGAAILKQRMDDWQTLIEQLQKKLSVPIWVELELGASIRVGDTVRYLLREYECTVSHTKSLLRNPANTEYWKLLDL